MAWTQERDTGDIVWSGWDQGIGASPHKGIANMQGVNLSTESGEVMAAFSRAQQSQVGTAAASQSGTAISTSRISSSFTLQNGVWITITASSVTGLSTGDYYVMNSGSGVFQLATAYITSGFGGLTSWAGTSGSITFHLKVGMGQPVAYAVESYQTSGQQYRYYVLDSQGLVWVYDAGAVNNTTAGFIYWFLPNTDITYFSGGTVPSGIAVLNGWVMVFSGASIYCKPTVDLSKGLTQFTNTAMNTFPTGTTPHFAYVGHQGRCYYTDGNYIGSIFPDTSLLTTSANIQSYASYGANTVTGTVGTLFSGSMPNNGLPTSSGGIRIPAVFFTDVNGVQPSNLTAGTIYYIENNNGALTFQVFAAATGGAAINIATGASGNQYYNTFYPISAGGQTTITYTPQRLNLPTFEIATCMVEIGNTIIIGAIGDVLYPWDQVSATPSDLIALPERYTYNLINVNNMAYAFSGNKGNIYITNGSVASLVLKVPDYCAGIAGTESSYIEPYFTWGGAAYIRGRIYFSVLDQTAAKAGNCGGIWSFVPTQNFYVGQDTGISLRLENQNSYGTYNGVATVLIPSQTQNAIAPQYWAGWYSNISSPLYGIDVTNTTPSTSAIIETDLVPTGTLVGKQKQTFLNIEYKLAAPLVSGETVTCKYRLNATDSFTALSAANVESATALSGYFSPLPFQNTQWLQLQVTLNPVASASSSFVRLTEIRARQQP